VHTLQEMVAPGLLAVLSPVAVGLAFRALGEWSGQPLLGAKAVASFLMFSCVSGPRARSCMHGAFGIITLRKG
jgi:Na+/H+-translocating membrane pyrophosphatase